ERRSLRATVAGNRSRQELTHGILDHRGERAPTSCGVLLEFSQQAVIQTNGGPHTSKHLRLSPICQLPYPALGALVARRAREGEGGEMQRGHALTRRHETELLAGHQQRQILADPAHSAERLVIRLREAKVLHRMDD